MSEELEEELEDLPDLLLWEWEWELELVREVDLLLELFWLLEDEELLLGFLSDLLSERLSDLECGLSE